MNDNRDDMNINELGAKAKKYVIALGACMVVFAVLTLVVSNNTKEPETILHTTNTTKDRQVEAELNNVPDTRHYETMIVPATQITTVPVAEKTEETVSERTAPVSYSLPLGTEISKDYSRGVPVYNDVMDDWRTHDGIDFDGEYGDGVKAIAKGIIKDVSSNSLMGDTVVVDHGGGVVATYCGVTASETIKKGIIVSQSQKIGEISPIPSESDSEFPHLHLEIRVDGELCDPLEIMGYFE